jgi:hypothetical protein
VFDPGLLAASIFGGIAVVGAGGICAPRLRSARAARAIRNARWTTHKQIARDGSIHVGLERRAGDLLIERRSVGELPAGTDELDVDVLVWEAKRRAGLYNDE